MLTFIIDATVLRSDGDLDFNFTIDAADSSEARTLATARLADRYPVQDIAINSVLVEPSSTEPVGGEDHPTAPSRSVQVGDQVASRSGLVLWEENLSMQGVVIEVYRERESDGGTDIAFTGHVSLLLARMKHGDRIWTVAPNAIASGDFHASIWQVRVIEPERTPDARPTGICPDCSRPITLQPSGWWTHDGLASDCWRSSMDGPDDAEPEQEDTSEDPSTDHGFDVCPDCGNAGVKVGPDGYEPCTRFLTCWSDPEPGARERRALAADNAHGALCDIGANPMAARIDTGKLHGPELPAVLAVPLQCVLRSRSSDYVGSLVGFGVLGLTGQHVARVEVEGHTYSPELGRIDFPSWLEQPARFGPGMAGGSPEQDDLADRLASHLQTFVILAHGPRGTGIEASRARELRDRVRAGLEISAVEPTYDDVLDELHSFARRTGLSFDSLAHLAEHTEQFPRVHLGEPEPVRIIENTNEETDMTDETRTYFRVPDCSGYGPDFDTREEAVTHARQSIRRIEGTDTFTRAFVDERRADASGDHPISREEVFAEPDYIEAARKLGREAGEAAGSWAADGNTSVDHARRVLAMMEEGDPEAEDFLPMHPDLSGEYANDPTPLNLARELLDGVEPTDDQLGAIADAWEQGASETFTDTCERELRAILPAERDPSIAGYVARRTRTEDNSEARAMGAPSKVGRTGDSRVFATEAEAEREAQAWRESGEWSAEVVTITYPISYAGEYGDAEISPNGCAVKGDAGQFYQWSHRPDNVWSCSELNRDEIDSVTAKFDSGGLVALDVVIDGSIDSDHDIPADELNAWTSDVLRAAGMPETHPAHYVAVGQFTEGR